MQYIFFIQTQPNPNEGPQADEVSLPEFLTAFHDAEAPVEARPQGEDTMMVYLRLDLDGATLEDQVTSMVAEKLASLSDVPCDCPLCVAERKAATYH
jgi:hypothetical protein